MWRSRDVLAVSLMALTSCTGHVVMTPMMPEQIASGYTGNTDVDGIIVFRPQPMIEVDRLTQATLPMPGDSTKTQITDLCSPVLTRKLITLVDWQHPYRLHYEHGLLETYTFGATMTADGILTTINTQSTPDQGKTIQNLASAATSAASIVPKLVTGTPPKYLPPCTSTPQFVGYEYPPGPDKITPFGGHPDLPPVPTNP
jgi:hypothetical protein